MCTVVILRRPEHPWPFVIACNRDEMVDRPWQPPRRHWPERRNVVAPLDELAMGTWLGLNDEGVLAAILNREGTLGPLAGKRTRGELVLEALDHADAVDAARALKELDPTAYRPFNLLVADNRDAYWLRCDGMHIDLMPIPEGVSMLTAHELDDEKDPRILNFRHQFETAALPRPEFNDWGAWRDLLQSPAPEGLRAQDGLEFQLDNGFGTRNASLIALPSIDNAGTEPVWLFCADAPSQGRFRMVAM